MDFKTVIAFGILLAVCLVHGAALGQLLDIQVLTDKSVYAVGETLALSVSGNNIGPGVSIDAHVAIISPDGTIRVSRALGFSTTYG